MRRKDPGPQPRSFSRFLGRVLPGAKPGKHPGFVEPQLATLKSKVPPGPRFTLEIKFDGSFPNGAPPCASAKLVRDFEIHPPCDA